MCVINRFPPTGSNMANIEFNEDDSPSRMRTRNTQNRDAGANKRPKRGLDSNDIQCGGDQLLRTPNKNDKKKLGKNDSPTRSKKRSNEDECSDDKEKRMRSDVSLKLFL